MSRTGLGRSGGFQTDAGDPLDGLVNLFDLGLVLAVAFLVAGLGLAVDPKSGAVVQRTTPQQTPSSERTLTAPSTPSTATGQGEEVGTLYRLADGSLVVVDGNGRQRATP